MNTGAALRENFDRRFVGPFAPVPDAAARRLDEGAVRRDDRPALKLALAKVGAGDTVATPIRWTMPAAIDATEWTHARPTPDTLVRDYLYADVATLIAPGATGKTTLLLYEAICIVLGLLLYGLEVLRRGPVLILTAEDSREMLVARLRSIAVEMGLSAEQIAVVMEQVRISDVSGTGLKLTKVRGDAVVPADTVDQVIAGCRDFKPVLIVIDPAVSFGIGESRVNDAEQGLVEAARKLRRALNCCVRYVHHTGKQNARDRTVDQYSGRGGSAFADGARMVAVLQVVTSDEWLQATGTELLDGDTGLRLARPKLSYAPPASDIFVRRTGYRFQHVMPSSNGAATLRDANANQVWQLMDSELKQGRYHSRNSLESLDHGIKRADLRKAIDWLVSSGRIETRDRPNNNQGGAYKYFHPVASPSNVGEPNQKQEICLASEKVVFASPPYTENNGGEAPPLVLSASVGSPEKPGEASAKQGEPTLVDGAAAFGQQVSAGMGDF
jgi:RecA-family ATPase